MFFFCWKCNDLNFTFKARSNLLANNQIKIRKEIVRWIKSTKPFTTSTWTTERPGRRSLTALSVSMSGSMVVVSLSDQSAELFLAQWTLLKTSLSGTMTALRATRRPLTTLKSLWSRSPTTEILSERVSTSLSWLIPIDGLTPTASSLCLPIVTLERIQRVCSNVALTRSLGSESSKSIL